MNATIRAADPAEPDAQVLIAALDADLSARYPGESTNGIDPEEFRGAGGYFVLVYCEGIAVPVACGAFRPILANCAEIKRMFVAKEHRGRGHSRKVLGHLEEVARARGYCRFVLETGVRQPEAIGLYESTGYFRIPNYAPYVGATDSVCYAKNA